MDIALTYALPILGVLLCMAGTYRTGRKEGFSDGYGYGLTAMLKYVVDGSVVVDDEHVTIGEDVPLVIQNSETGERVTVLDKSELEFVEENGVLK